MPFINSDGSEQVGESYASAAISAAATTVVKSGAGQLGYLSILGGTVGTITVYDNTAASGTVLVPTFTPGAYLPETLVFKVNFSIGLTIVTSAATVLQVSFR